MKINFNNPYYFACGYGWASHSFTNGLLCFLACFVLWNAMNYIWDKSSNKDV